jgi:hypothetical protein
MFMLHQLFGKFSSAKRSNNSIDKEFQSIARKSISVFGEHSTGDFDD